MGILSLPGQSCRLWRHWDLAKSSSAQGSCRTARARLRQSEKEFQNEFFSSVLTACSDSLPPHFPEEVCPGKCRGAWSHPGWLGNRHGGPGLTEPLCLCPSGERGRRCRTSCGSAWRRSSGAGWRRWGSTASPESPPTSRL